MKIIAGLLLFGAAGLVVTSRGFCLSCPACKAVTAQLEYLGSPSADDPETLERIEDWDDLLLSGDNNATTETMNVNLRSP